MEKNEETRRRRREADRLSRLPNDVLCRILSFLTTKQTVRTSVLSKRWTNLWLSVPDIEINDIFIWSIKLNNRFNNFLNSILIARDDAGTPFNRLSLDVGYGSPHLAFKIGFPKVLKSINFVLKRELKYLRLNLNLDDFDDCDNEYDVNERFLFKLPKTILNCKTLVGLDLSHFTFPIYSFSSDEFGFPSLKTLKLSDVNFDGNFALFLSGCPILEDLTMFQVWYARNNYTQFKSLSLSKLIKADIDDCSCDSFALHALSAAESLCLDTFKMHAQEREFYEEIKGKVRFIMIMIHAKLIHTSCRYQTLDTNHMIIFNNLSFIVLLLVSTYLCRVGCAS